jgi:hypothetical protein
MAGDVPQNPGELPMIAYLRHDQIDKTCWDDCIAQAVNGNVYAWSWYLDLVHPEWEALVEMKDDNYLSVMPLTGNMKYGIHYLFQPFFVQQLGVFSREELSPGKVGSFLEAIPKKFRLIQIRLNEGNEVPDRFRGVEHHCNHLLDLRLDYSKLFSDYHENTRRNLKKSLKYGLRLVKAVPMERVIALFRENRGASIRHWGDAEYRRLLALSQCAVSSSKAFVYGVQTMDNEDVVCGALFLVSHQRITFLFSGNNSLGRESHAMTFLIDQVIREYAATPFTLDFEGSDDEALGRFYSGFGSVSITYPSYSRLPWWWFKK